MLTQLKASDVVGEIELENVLTDDINSVEHEHNLSGRAASVPQFPGVTITAKQKYTSPY